MISAYFAWRRGRGRPRNEDSGLWPGVISILVIWVFCLSLTCVPLFGICGQFGYDPIHGKCHLLPCKKCSSDGVISIPPGMLIEAIGFGVPSLVVIISYSLVYIKLTQSGENAEVTSLKKAVLVLTVCYFFFILPNVATAWLPSEVNKWALIGTLLDCWTG